MPSAPSRRVELVTFGSPRFRTVEAGGLLVTDAEFPPGATLCPHVHDRTCVATTVEGRFDSRLARRLVGEIGAPDAVTPLAIEALGLELLAVAARRFSPDRPGPRTPAWLERVRERLHDAFDEPAGLSELASIAGVHAGHLTRAFRRHYGQSVGAYQRAARLEWAAR